MIRALAPFLAAAVATTGAPVGEAPIRAPGSGVVATAAASVSVEIVRAERATPDAPAAATRRTLRVERNVNRGGAFVEFE